MDDYGTTVVFPGGVELLRTTKHAEVWSTSLTASRHRSPASKTANQAVFLRDLRICLRQEVWDGRYEGVRPRPFLFWLLSPQEKYIPERERHKIEERNGPLRRAVRRTRVAFLQEKDTSAVCRFISLYALFEVFTQDSTTGVNQCKILLSGPKKKSNEVTQNP